MRERYDMRTGVTLRLRLDAELPDDGRHSSDAEVKAKPRVLLVEDYYGVCELLAHPLREWGYAVAEAHSGENALQILDTEPGFEFGVFDLRLPGLSGEELASYCRAHEDLKRMKLIAISGERERLDNDLFDRSLAKPFGPSDLKRLLEEVLETESFCR